MESGVICNLTCIATDLFPIPHNVFNDATCKIYILKVASGSGIWKVKDKLTDYEDKNED